MYEQPGGFFVTYDFDTQDLLVSHKYFRYMCYQIYV